MVLARTPSSSSSTAAFSSSFSSFDSLLCQVHFLRAETSFTLDLKHRWHINMHSVSQSEEKWGETKAKEGHMHLDITKDEENKTQGSQRSTESQRGRWTAEWACGRWIHSRMYRWCIWVSRYQENMSSYLSSRPWGMHLSLAWNMIQSDCYWSWTLKLDWNRISESCIKYFW